MTSSAHQQDEWYQQLPTLSRQAYAEQAFEMAYHTLAAAMYRAKDLGDVSLLRELLQEVERQKKQLDSTYPAHSLSSSSAHTRGHESVYTGLQRQISTQIQFYETQGMLQELKKHHE